MALPWLTALKVIPWGDVIEHAPKVLNAARKLMDRQKSPEAAPANATPMDLVADTPPSLGELRNRLIWAVMSYIIAILACFVVAEPILNFMLHPIELSMRALGDPNPVMQYTSPQEYFFTLVRIAMVAGFAVAFPVIGYQLWRFIAPGLYKSEKNAFLPFLIASPALFLTGAAFSHYVVTPIAMDFFLGFADASSIVAAIIPTLTDIPGDVPAADTGSDTGIDIVFQGKVNETLDISLKLIMAFGLCFQLPVLLTLMGKAGIVSSTGLIAMRKYAVVLILIVAAGGFGLLHQTNGCR